MLLKLLKTQKKKKKKIYFNTTKEREREREREREKAIFFGLQICLPAKYGKNI